MRAVALLIGLLLILAHLWAALASLWSGGWMFAVATGLIYPNPITMADEFRTHLAYDDGSWLGPVTIVLGTLRLVASGALVTGLAAMVRASRLAAGIAGAIALFSHALQAVGATAVGVLMWGRHDDIFLMETERTLGELAYTLTPVRLFLVLGVLWIGVLLSGIELAALLAGSGRARTQD